MVHGSIVGPDRTFREQAPLGAHWALKMPFRPGFGASPPLRRGDFEAEAPLIAELLGDGAHLVGHSYGGVIALLAAELRPEAVWSLTVSEPGALGVARGDPLVDTVMAHGDELFRRRDEIGPVMFLKMFRAGVDSAHETPDELPDWLARGVALTMNERPSWEAEIPFAALAAASFPKLVISGDHSPAFELVCDRLAEGIGARREIIRGRGHTIPTSGAPYNDMLHEFFTTADTARRA
jgi:pimeloyl-ACP methyl ester carboxylesterase